MSFEIGLEAEQFQDNHSLSVFALRYFDVLGNEHVVNQRVNERPAISVSETNKIIGDRGLSGQR
jgi:hypothetical protein